MLSIRRLWPERWAILDCNAFYSSCERVFRPHLRTRPVVVLSNNDGCMISVSPEAKLLGLKLGAPVHEVREIIRKHRVHVFSSNYQLYGDLSRRVMRILDELHPDVLQYSIDEAFIDFSHVPPGDEERWAHEVCLRVTRETGIPVTIGIGRTKTIAKIASKRAKKIKQKAMYLADKDIEAALRDTPVGDVWGIGPGFEAKLKMHNIRTAWEFREHPNSPLIRALLTVTGERLREELRGVSCVEPGEMAEKKMISSTRSFGRRVYDRIELEEAVSTYVGFACEKLRAQNSVARGISVFLRTSAFEDKTIYHRNDGQIFLVSATSDTGQFTRAAIEIVRSLYRRDTPYKKAGIFLFDISPRAGQQVDLFQVEDARTAPLMSAMDSINKKWGRGTIRMAACGTKQDWRMLCEKRSDKTQLQWHDLVEVKAESSVGRLWDCHF
jgi:DNA polymerase V